MKKLKEKEISSKTVFKGKFLTVKQDSVLLPNGEIGTREWIKHPGAACCVPILPNGDIVLIKQYRYSLKREMIELPAGKRNKNESFEECARRELEEEIGYKTNKLTFLTEIHPAIGFTNEKINLYLAEGLVKTKMNLDKDEFLELKPTKLHDAIEMVWDGTITDVKTIIGLNWVQKRFG